MKKLPVMMVALLALLLFGCQGGSKQADHTIQQMEDTRYTMEIDALSHFEKMDMHTQPTQMDADHLYLIGAARQVNTDALVPNSVFAYDWKQKTWQTIKEKNADNVYYDYQVYKGDAYAIVGPHYENGHADNHREIWKNGTSIMVFNGVDNRFGSLHIYQDKLYLMLQSFDNSLIPSIYQIIDSGRFKTIHNAFVSRLVELSSTGETAPLIRMYGNRITYLYQKETTMELGIYEHKKLTKYEIPFTGKILAIFKNDVLIRAEDGACYWNVKQNLRKVIDNADFAEDSLFDYQQINQNQLLYNAKHYMKVFTYHGEDTYLLQEVSDEPYQIEMVHRNQILLRQDDDYYLSTLKD